MRDDRITVIEVMRAMNVEPTPKLSWSVGQIVMRKFAAATGHQPPKDNRPKTYTEGVHCFALYPPSWRAEIEAVIRSHRVEEARQGAFSF